MAINNKGKEFLRKNLKHTTNPGHNFLYANNSGFGSGKRGNSNQAFPGWHYTETQKKIAPNIKRAQQSSVDVIHGGQKMAKTVKGMERIKRGSPLAVFDTEIIGDVASGKRFGADKGLFGLTQFSFGLADSVDDLSQGNFDINNIVFRQTSEVQNEVRGLIDKLDKNPAFYYSLDQRTRESLADLATFSNVDDFGPSVNIGGVDYKTLPTQQAPLPVSSGSLTSRKGIEKMRAGLENISNPELTTAPEKLNDAVMYLRSQDAVLIGHNSELFDTQVIDRYLQQTGGSKEARGFVHKPHVDTFLMSQNVVNKKGGPQSENLQLGTLAKNIAGVDVDQSQTHNAGYDIFLESKLFSSLESLYSSSDYGFNQVSPGQSFQVQKGISFRPNEFNKNAGQYDAVYSMNEKTGARELLYDNFRYPTGRGSNEMIFEGRLTPMNFDGVRHHGIEMYNPEMDTYHTFWRQSESEISDLFSENFVPYGDIAEDQAEYFKKDSARREYNRIFTQPARYETDTVTTRLNSAYEIIDVYNDEVNKLAGIGDAAANQEKAIEETLERINKQRASQNKKPFGRSRVRNTTMLSDRLGAEKNLWREQVGSELSSVKGFAADEATRTARENDLYKNVFTQLNELVEPGEYGYEGMSVLQLPKVSQPGEFTHHNVQSRSQVESLVRRELYGDRDLFESGKNTLHFNNLMDTMGDVMDEKDINKWRKELQKDLKRGKISPGLVDQISEEIINNRELLASGGKIVNSIPGMDLDRPFSADALQNGAELAGKKPDDFLTGIIDDTKQDLLRRTARGQGAANVSIQDPLLRQRLKGSNKSQRLLRDGLREKTGMMGFNKPKVDPLQTTDAFSRTQKLLQTYENMGFNVALSQPDGSNKVLFSATPNANIDLTGMTPADIETNKDIFSTVLPLYNDDYGIDTGLGTMIDVKHARLREGVDMSNLKPGDVTFASSSDLMFDEIEGSAHTMRKRMKDGYTAEDAVRSAQSRVYRKNQSAGLARGFSKPNIREDGFISQSAEKARNSMLNMQPFYERLAKERYPEEYARFLRNRRNDSTYNIMQAFSPRDKTNFRLEGKNLYNEAIGDSTGTHLYSEGLNTNQAGMGMFNIVPPQMSNPFGEYGSGMREQVNKAVNYTLVDEEPLKRFYEQTYNPIAAETGLDPAKMADQNKYLKEQGIRAYEATTLYVGNEPLAEASKAVASKLDVEISELKSVPGKLTSEQRSRLSSLEKMKKQVDRGLISTFEDESVMSTDLLSSIQISEELNIELDKYDIPQELNTYIKETYDLDQLPEGRIDFGEGITINQMRKMGIVDEDDMLTVGRLSQEYIASAAGVEFGDASKRRLQKGALLKGVSVDSQGRQTVHLDNRYIGGDSNKVLDMVSGARQTQKGIDRELIGMFGEEIAGTSNIDAIAPFEKMGPGGRRSTGSAYDTLVRTSAYNVGEAIDAYHADGSSSLKSVNEFFKDRQLGESSMDDYQAFMQEKFVPSINEAFGTEQIAYGAGGSSSYEYTGTDLGGDQADRQGMLKNLYAVASEEYGFDTGVYGDNDYMVGRRVLGQHNINYWQGSATDVKYGPVEQQILRRVAAGPTKTDLTKIRELGTLGGVDYSDYQGYKRSSDDSLMIRNIERATDPSMRAESAEFIRQVDQSKNFSRSDQGIEDIKMGGNVIVDIAGDYNFEDTSNFLEFGEGPDKYYVVDGSRIRKRPDSMAIGAEMRGTYGNLSSVELYSDTMETTVGELVKAENSSIYAQLINPDSPIAQETPLANNVVRVVPMLESKSMKQGGIHLEEFEKSMINAMETAYDIAHGGPEDASQAEKWLGQQIRNMEMNMSNFEKESNKWLGSRAIKEHMTIISDNSFSYGLQGRNSLHTNYSPDEIGFSEDNIRAAITGIEDNVLKANKISMETLSEETGIDLESLRKQTPAQLAETQQSYIIDRLKGPSGDDGFALYTTIHRDPVQSEGSFIVARARIDDTLDRDSISGISDPRIAAQKGGDFDGDNEKMTTLVYRGAMDEREAVRLQNELSETSKYTVGRAVAEHHEGQARDMASESLNSMFEIMSAEDPEVINTIFGKNLNNALGDMTLATEDIMSVNVGALYNPIVSQRTAIDSFAAAQGIDAPGTEAFDRVREIMQRTTEEYSVLQQSAISRKKIGPEEIVSFMGLDSSYGTPDGFQKLHEEGLLQDTLTSFVDKRNQLPGKVRNIRPTTVGDLMKDLESLSIFDFGDDDAARKSVQEDFLEVAYINEYLATTPIGGFDNKFYNMGMSSGDDALTDFSQTFMEAPQTIPLTPQTEEMANVLFEGQDDLIEGWKTTQKNIMSDTDTYNRIREGVTGGTNTGASKTILDQLDDIKFKETTGKSRSGRSITAENFSRGFSNITRSKVTQAAAGITAAWVVGRALAKGPTPEGNEAQQEEATAEEVAPSQLLTSPTARVQSGAEGVDLTVSASGNMDEIEVAGIINNEIASMTGTPMNMNVNVTDNTAQLDSKYFERVINRTFGF